MSGDHWVRSGPSALHLSSVGRSVLMRCKGCRQMFRREAESTATCPACPPGTACTSNLAATYLEPVSNDTTSTVRGPSKSEVSVAKPTKEQLQQLQDNIDWQAERGEDTGVIRQILKIGEGQAASSGDDAAEGTS